LYFFKYDKLFLGDLMNFWGITETYSGDLNLYHAGRPDYMPLALFLALDSKHNNAAARYFNYFGAHTKEAHNLAEHALQYLPTVNSMHQCIEYPPQTNQSLPTTIPVWTPPTKEERETAHSKAMDELRNPVPWLDDPKPDNIPLFLYSNKFAEVLASSTPTFNSGHEGTPQTCPMSHIKFYGRTEFRELYKMQKNVLELILKKTEQYLKTKNIEVTEHCLHIPGYKIITHTIDTMDGW
jgi:hypothetical protein